MFVSAGFRAMQPIFSPKQLKQLGRRGDIEVKWRAAKSHSSGPFRARQAAAQPVFGVAAMMQKMSSASLNQFPIAKTDRNVWPWFTMHAKAFAVWRQHQKDTRVLAAMDDRLLHDIGLTRGEIWNIGRHF